MSRNSTLVSWCLPFVIAQLNAGCSPSPTTAPRDAGEDEIPVSICTAPTGAGTVHDEWPAQDETWTAEASPHVVTTNLTIERTLTLAPCAVVQMKGDVGMLVRGTLLAEGAADRPIRIERQGATAWTSIETSKDARVRLAHVTLEGGGNAGGGRPTQSAALDVRGDQELATQPVLFVDHVRVVGSASLGIWVREGGGFAPGSTALTITGGSSFPMEIWASAAGSIPEGSYTGNATDEIILPANGVRDDIVADTTFAARGVPYRVGGPTGGRLLRVGSAATNPLLTIEAGVILRFDPETRLEIDGAKGTPHGALRARGTAAAPIVFTSAAAAPAAGDWVGLTLKGGAEPRTELAFATISYAGGPSGISSYGCPSPLNRSFSNEAAVIIFDGEPSRAFVTNTTITYSAGEGIVRGWTGAPVDFLQSNTFEDVARCHQTFPKPAAGNCPDPAPCPQ